MMLAAGIIALAVGTYAFRWAGPALRSRIQFPDRAKRLLEVGATVLLAALVAVETLPFTEDHVSAALPAGVLVAGVLAWRRFPLLLVILAAAATTAGLRALGVA
ncbi:AzlD domain-containing protein [Nocardia goodfellowii]|uniref:Branched-subunit amino acid transport protein n=1 Tax=Nocardia goodfellowii TaxID=882446 RepID=A0ABS4QT52_9NOCA|nr:AzlD domain-containing protein [Nocardia goodfellowii]MBP2194199.1 branched-subunit amino acid transport protein [Nocardia goodfellowii]